MDERRAGSAESVNHSAGMALNPPVSPFGSRAWIGTALGILYFMSAVWSVADRVIGRLVAGTRLQAGYQTFELVAADGVGALAVIGLMVLAAGSTESLPDKAAFAAFALAELVQGLGMIPGAAVMVTAVCVLTAGLVRAAAWCVVYVNRENCRDAKRVSLAVGCVWIVRTLMNAVTSWAAWMLMSGRYAEVWVRTLSAMNDAMMFAAIVGGVLSGMGFLLLRTPVPTTTYPEKRR